VSIECHLNDGNISFDYKFAVNYPKGCQKDIFDKLSMQVDNIYSLTRQSFEDSNKYRDDHSAKNNIIEAEISFENALTIKRIWTYYVINEHNENNFAKLHDGLFKISQSINHIKYYCGDYLNNNDRNLNTKNFWSDAWGAVKAVPEFFTTEFFTVPRSLVHSYLSKKDMVAIKASLEDANNSFDYKFAVDYRQNCSKPVIDYELKRDYFISNSYFNAKNMKYATLVSSPPTGYLAKWPKGVPGFICCGYVKTSKYSIDYPVSIDHDFVRFGHYLFDSAELMMSATNYCDKNLDIIDPPNPWGDVKYEPNDYVVLN
jgi:hypothetical protein